MRIAPCTLPKRLAAIVGPGLRLEYRLTWHRCDPPRDLIALKSLERSFAMPSRRRLAPRTLARGGTMIGLSDGSEPRIVRMSRQSKKAMQKVYR